ncbi:peptide ABC transporter ATP-binding protein, partial [Sinorhizobium medicae]
PPNPADRPSGCAFHPRCPVAQDICRTSSPALRRIGDGRTAACHAVAGETASIETMRRMA